ncbi:MAG: nickel-dependent lactate racemase [Clostridiaceae bacterium]|nr:nickel-dependent lactate racemase [Clostridiaceae bacterium]
MKVKLPYGADRTVEFAVPDACFDGMLAPRPVLPAPDPAAEIARAIDSPIGTPTLDRIVREGTRVCVICDDISRPTPVSAILPVLLERLHRAGVRREDVQIVMALGSHRYMTEDEMRGRVGEEIYGRYRVKNSEFRDPEKLLHVGVTGDGVDIVVTRDVMDADVRIGIGNIVPHPVMGWSGGGKILFPGVTGEHTVAQFHMLGGLSDERLVGLENNPVRTRMESWVPTIGLHFIVNTVLDAGMRIVRVVAGDYVQAHRAGVETAKRVMCCPMKRKADVIVVSSFPADEDFWQSGKGFCNAEGGLRGADSTMILVSPNTEGMGPHAEYGACFGRDDSGELLRRLYRGENVPGDPLALAVGTSMSKMRRRCRMVVVSDGVTRGEIEGCGIAYYPLRELQKAVDDTLARYESPVVAAVSHGGEFLL